MTRRSSISSLLRTRYRIELIVIDRSATSPAGKNQREKARREVAQRNRALSVRCHAFRLSSEDWPRLELTQKLAQKKHQKLHRHKPRQSLPSFEPGVRWNSRLWLGLICYSPLSFQGRGQKENGIAKAQHLILPSIFKAVGPCSGLPYLVCLSIIDFKKAIEFRKAKKYDDSAAGRASSADERTLAKEQHLSKPLFIHLALPMLVRCQYSTLRRGPIAAEARASRSIISLWDILPRICGGMYTWSNSSRTKSSEPMLTADELTTAAEELVIAQIPSRSELYRRALPARRDGTKGTFLFFLPLSSANNIFSYEILFDLDKKISTRNPINPRTFLPSAFGLNGKRAKETKAKALTEEGGKERFAFDSFSAYLLLRYTGTVCYWISMILGDLSLFLQILGSLAGRSLSLLFGKIGFSGGLAFAIGLAVKAILTADGAPSMFMLPYGADAGSEASVNQELHHPSRSGPAAPTPTSASSSAVEQPIPEDKPYIALLQLEGERKRILEEIVHFVEGQLEDPGLPRGPHEQALRFLWSEL
ncbi:hypothetical protein VNO80_35226 [Phaseolus coccineus]|uniref:Uncharacterized protein n=1 Tax=Phaseolus coccineus TaxID=3886 RepID=A0AAN9Q4K2_PHACN